MQQSQDHKERQPSAGAQGAFPTGVHTKFNVDGSVRPFPGNTIICHLAATSRLYAALSSLYGALEQSDLSELYSLLPPSSWHMTVFEGVCDQVRRPGFWPADLGLDAPLAECDGLFADKLSAFDRSCDPPYRLRIAGWQPLVNGIALRLAPTTSGEETRLRHLRDRLSDLLQLRHPGHEDYVFHLSIAYLIRYPNEEQQAALSALLFKLLSGLPAEFELGAPEFCRFDDMFAFRRQFFLQSPARGG
ncbi:hypothetical protein GGE16_005157 [Rhizobium leguminosarum]|uniref:DUF1868 domain-containing protein n=1 Tax=Rhizobium leguminosarum TaxID=384 RepID=A0AAE2MPE7_RHILE|nr:MULTISPECIES: DUF1868 domain-containing protein [Rhizobium]MBB4293072.1 hypothetical protein [Rhizobium leguminosarum]MBB4300105.1 hypothetical protein [Rhizobium leguminosarum]MBB4311231.1 hypothetical protein [Rhizobium leguminosarum]MBB4435458.1 hypothetical protein [Rhizobium esperanzae]MBB4532390.1 hypothetical protein [Rhizobium leguminosarum]